MIPLAIDLVAIGQLLVAGGVGAIVVAVINNFLSPKTKAETRAIAQKAAGDEIDRSFNQLRLDITSARDRAERAETRADKLAERVDALEAALDLAESGREELVRRQTQLEAQLDDALEQKDLLGAQLTAAQEEIVLLRKRNEILLAHINQQAAWATRYYEAGHPPGMEPPPILLPFA